MKLKFISTSFAYAESRKYCGCSLCNCFRLKDVVVTPIKGSDFILKLQVTCLKGHLSEMELCRFRNLTLNLALTLTLTVCLYVSDK